MSLNRFLGTAVFGLFALLTVTVHAEGSVSFQEDIVPILKTKPVFMKFILNVFQIKYRGNGWARRIGNDAIPQLGGERIGPYRFQATWRGSDGDMPITLVINTNNEFFDQIGRKIINNEDFYQAHSVRQTFASVEIFPEEQYKYPVHFLNPLPNDVIFIKNSVSFQTDILPILKIRPTFEKFILGTFKIDDDGWGERIDKNVVPCLGGARMGPYRFHATWHGSNGDTPITLIINTTTVFFDGAGQEIEKGSLVRAKSSKEIFDSIEVNPA
jgi:hypothetical protein